MNLEHVHTATIRSTRQDSKVTLGYGLKPHQGFTTFTDGNPHFHTFRAAAQPPWFTGFPARHRPSRA